jgi:hypothetical protein
VNEALGGVWRMWLLGYDLLAYYRGWKGVATGLALGMGVFSLGLRAHGSQP